jgi:two-component system chemotaxis sensor kinase CheA
VQDNDRRCCLMVDELLGQQQVVIKSLGEGIGAVPGISGGAILGDGNVSLILDIHALIELASMGDPASANPSLSQKEIV